MTKNEAVQKRGSFKLKIKHWTTYELWQGTQEYRTGPPFQAVYVAIRQVLTQLYLFTDFATPTQQSWTSNVSNLAWVRVRCWLLEILPFQ